jgi:hypothetical protein
LAKVMALPSGKVMVTCSGLADTGLLLLFGLNWGRWGRTFGLWNRPRQVPSRTAALVRVMTIVVELPNR